MKKILLLLYIMLLSSLSFSQVNDDLGFINALGEKEKATFGDAVTFFVFEAGSRLGRFESNVNFLKQRGILIEETYTESQELRRGVIARMVARRLNLRGSLLYNLFGTERYACKACIFADIMDENISEWDILSGEEVIEIMRRMTEAQGANGS